MPKFDPENLQLQQHPQAKTERNAVKCPIVVRFVFESKFWNCNLEETPIHVEFVTADFQIWTDLKLWFARRKTAWAGDRAMAIRVY